MAAADDDRVVGARTASRAPPLVEVGGAGRCVVAASMAAQPSR